jgi:hypothetical protein
VTWQVQSPGSYTKERDCGVYPYSRLKKMFHPMPVGRCRLTVSKHVLKAPMVSSLETGLV